MSKDGRKELRNNGRELWIYHQEEVLGCFVRTTTVFFAPDGYQVMKSLARPLGDAPWFGGRDAQIEHDFERLCIDARGGYREDPKTKEISHPDFTEAWKAWEADEKANRDPWKGLGARTRYPQCNGTRETLPNTS